MVAVAYERSFNYRALTGNLMFWIGGRLREVVAHGGSTELTNCLRGFAEHNRYKKICNLWTPLNTRNLHGGNTVHISLKAKIKCYWFDCMRRFWRESEYGKPMGRFVVGSHPCSERFFSGCSGFPVSSKTNTSNSNTIWNSRTRLNEFIWTPMCFVGTQAIFSK